MTEPIVDLVLLLSTVLITIVSAILAWPIFKWWWNLTHKD